MKTIELTDQQWERLEKLSKEEKDVKKRQVYYETLRDGLVPVRVVKRVYDYFFNRHQIELEVIKKCDTAKLRVKERILSYPKDIVYKLGYSRQGNYIRVRTLSKKELEKLLE